MKNLILSKNVVKFFNRTLYTTSCFAQNTALNFNRCSQPSFNFEPSENCKSLVKMTRDFVQREIIPIERELDSKGDFPFDIIKKAHALGLMNLFIPAKYGGSGISYVDALLMLEEIGYGCTGVGLAMTLNSLGGSAILVHGNEEQKEYVARLAKYPSVVSFCTTEPGTGSDVAGIKTHAVRDSDGSFILNGEKSWITNAAHAEWFLVIARTNTDPNAKASRALSAFLIEKDAKGITIGKKESNLGQRCSDTRAVSFEEVRVSPSQIVGDEGSGFKVSMTAFDYQRPSLAALAVGLSRRVADEATKYALATKNGDRCVFDSQSTQFKLADMAAGIENCRLAYLKAGWMYDRGVRNTGLAAIAKCTAADLANKCAADAIEIMGEDGYSTQYPVEKLMRDAKVFQIYGGTCEIQRMIIAREHERNFREKFHL